MMIKSLLKKCETGFDRVIVADSTSGHTMEYSSVKDAQIGAGDNKIISWEVGCYDEGWEHLMFVLFITI